MWRPVLFKTVEGSLGVGWLAVGFAVGQIFVGGIDECVVVVIIFIFIECKDNKSIVIE